MEHTLGKRITTNRKRLGMTQDQLAEKLGITAQAVSKWENDLSCPDISILPKLADIFQITTDELLGRDIPIPPQGVTVIDRGQEPKSTFTYDSNNGKMDLHCDGIKLEGIGLACWVLLTGVVYLFTQLLTIEINFWNILWPTFLFVFGVFGLFPKFSVFRLGCTLVGCYFLIDKLQILSISFNSGILIAAIILLFGIALLADALRKSKTKSKYTHMSGKINHGKMLNDYSVDRDQFRYDASFGSCTQPVQLDILRFGEVSTSFGEYAVDLSGVISLAEDCRINADCAFGELTIFVPKRYGVIPDSSTSFASFNVLGQSQANPQGTIHLHADASFGEINVEYI